MQGNRRGFETWQFALIGYALLAAGCHGWLPALLQGAALLIVGAFLLGLAGPSRVPVALAWIRYVPLVIGVWARQSLAVDMLASAGLIVGLFTVSDGPAISASRRQTIARSLLTLALVQLALSTGTGYHVEQSIASGIGAIGSALIGETIDLGPVFGGARSLLVGVTVMLALIQHRVIPLVLSVGGLIVVAVLATVVVGLTAARLPAFGSTPSIVPITSVVAAQLPWLPFLLTVAAVPLLVRLGTTRVHCTTRDWSVSVFSLATAACVLTSLAPAPLRPTEKLVFYRPGFSNWDVAETDLTRAGPYSSGMLGSFPQFARALGLRADLVDAIDAETLRECDTLVLINQNEPLADGAPALISDWVRAGGHLIVIGDHTFIHRYGDAWTIWLNETLEETGIRFPNNSSDHLTTAFLDATVTTGLGRRIDCVPDNPYSPIIGAGLEVRWPARPIVIGRFGYLDVGVVPTAEQDKSLGDLTWNPGERLGGIVLLAEQQLGAGRVTVIGDTTGIHNIARSVAWHAVGDLVMARPRDARWAYWSSALVLVGMCGLRLVRRVGLLVEALLAIGVLGGIATFGNFGDSSDLLRNPDEPLAIFDTAVKPAGQRGTWTKDGYLTLVSSSLRVGYLPLFSNTERHGIPIGAKVVIVSRPQIDPGDAWRRHMLEWVHNGGHLILAGDISAQRVLGDLLREVGCEIEPLVTGPQSVRVGDAGSSQSFALRVQESWNLRLLTGEWTRIVYGPRTTTIASRILGVGRATVITDPWFLQNRNQESQDVINPENIRFMMQLLRGQEGA